MSFKSPCRDRRRLTQSNCFLNSLQRPAQAEDFRPTSHVFEPHELIVLIPGSIPGLEHYVADLTVMRIADAGHYPMRSHPEPVNQAIRRFLRRAK